MSDTTTPTIRPEPSPDADRPPSGARVAALVRWLLVAVMALAAFGSLAYYFGWFRGGGGSAVNASPTYYCPMHPGERSDHPGECPICGMTMVPLPAAGTPATQPTPPTVPGLVPVQLTAERIQLSGMRTAKAARTTLATSIRSVGVISASEKGLAQIETRFTGWVTSLAVAETGQKVTRGQILATVYSPDLVEAQQEFLNALRWDQPKAAPSAPAAGDHTEHSRSLDEGMLRGLAKDARARLELLGVGKEDIDEIERTGIPLRELRLRSPVAGYVIQKNVVQGAYITPGTPLFAIADLSRVWMLVDVYERDMRRVKVGQGATLSLAAYPGESFPGKVTFLYPTVDPSTRTLRVRVELVNPDLRLRPGMYGQVELAAEEGASAVTIPTEALVDTGTQYVFLALAGGRFVPRRVTVGQRAGDQTQILDGLAEGDVVVTTANFLVDSESRLRAAVEGAPEAAAASVCDGLVDKTKFPDKYDQCRSCEAHRGMGSMEEDCRNAIPKPWR